MGILSDLIRAPIGQAPSRGRGMGAISARPNLPMPPRRKGGLPGLIQRVKDKRLERPISIGDDGGGFLKRAARNVNQQIRNVNQQGGPQSGTMLPIMPPSIPGLNIPNLQQQGMRFDPITRKMVPAVGPDMSGKIPVSPSIGGMGGDRPIDITNMGQSLFDSYNAGLDNLSPYEKEIRQIARDGRRPEPVSLPITPPPPKLPPNEPPIDITNMGQSLLDSYDAGLNNLSPYEQTIRQIARDGRRPIPPQDFGFGPGIRPTEIRGPDGRINAGSAGVTPPDSRVDDFVATTGQEVFDKDYFDRIGIPDPRTNIGGLQTSIEGINPPPTPDVGLAQPAPVTDPIVPTVDPVQPAPTEPAAVAPTAGADPTQTQMPMGAIDPVLLQQQTSEKLTDPLIRSLYFGTQDSPGFYQQLQQAGANLIGSDVPLQQTAGLSPLELLARQKAVAGLGGFEPFLQQNRDLVNQAIAQSRRAEELQDPYYTQAEEIYKDTMGAYDPSMTQQFYNPYEDAVVQKTIQDVMEAGDKQDIASRAREISSGAFGGSRARLGAEERRESLGEGLAQALGNIRSQGFQSAQATGLGEFARQQAAKRTGAQGLMGIGVGRGSAASQLGSQLAGYGSQIGGIGQTQEQMRAGQRGELSGYGGIGRGIAETGLGRIFEQQVGQQYRPMQTLGQIGSMLPGYQASQTQIDSGYGMPTDPTAAGLGAAFSAYGALAPRQEGQG